MSLFGKTRRVIVVWPGDDRVEPMYSGQPVLIPATNEVATLGEDSPFRYPSAKDSSGAPIPGTVILETLTAVNEKGERHVVFDAEQWCEGIKDVNKPLMNRGLDFVELPEQVSSAKRAGRPKWEARQVERWERTLRDELERQKNFKEKTGMPAPQSSDIKNIMEAHAGLKALNAKRASQNVSEADIAAVLSGTVEAPNVQPAQPVSLPKPAVEADDIDYTETERRARALWQRAKNEGVYLNATDKTGLLDANPHAIKAVEAKIAEKLRANALNEAAAEINVPASA